RSGSAFAFSFLILARVPGFLCSEADYLPASTHGKQTADHSDPTPSMQEEWTTGQPGAPLQPHADVPMQRPGLRDPRSPDSPTQIVRQHYFLSEEDRVVMQVNLPLYPYQAHRTPADLSKEIT